MTMGVDMTKFYSASKFSQAPWSSDFQTICSVSILAQICHVSMLIFNINYNVVNDTILSI